MFEHVFGFITPIDLGLFRFINGLPRFFPVDIFFLFISAISSFGIIWVFLSLWFYGKYRNKQLLFLVILFDILGFIIVEFILKFSFARLRPTLYYPSTITYGPSFAEFFNSFSFPSGHAFMAFGVIPLFTFFYKRLFWPLIIFGCFVFFSRIYLGKHYPFDVFIGAILGLFVAKILLYLFVSLSNKN